MPALILPISAAACRWLTRLLLAGALLAPARFASSQRAQAGTPQQAPSTSIGIQYEQWFYGPESWQTAEAVPMAGHYTTDEATVSKHYSAFQRLGFDWLLIDWSNMLWATPPWEGHTGDTKKLEDTTEVLFRTAADRRTRGEFAPKLVFMIGLQNGPRVPNGMARLNGEIQWLQEHYLDRPENKDAFLNVDGKPLLTILYWPPDPCSQLPQDLAQTPLHAERWTVRWMASQLQDNHAERCGMWSWMDGVIPQVVTSRNGHAEELVVTPSSFQLPGRGWTDSTAIARDHGVPYLRSWQAAFTSRPRFLQVHQWNEFAGQLDGHGLQQDYWGNGKPAGTPHEIFADEYNQQLSDDMEPTRMDGCGLRGCGGWGYYYVNLTKALISLYRGHTPDITVLALSGPETFQAAREKQVHLEWAFVGKSPRSYTLWVDGAQVGGPMQGSSYDLNTTAWKPGSHKIELRATGVSTRFDLDPAKEAVVSKTPLPVNSMISILAR